MALDQLTHAAALELLNSFGPAPTNHETILTITRITRPKGTGADPRTSEVLGVAAAEFHTTVADVVGAAPEHVASHSIITTPPDPTYFGFDSLDEFTPPE